MKTFSQFLAEKEKYTLGVLSTKVKAYLDGEEVEDDIQDAIKEIDFELWSEKNPGVDPDNYVDHSGDEVEKISDKKLIDLVCKKLKIS